MLFLQIINNYNKVKSRSKEEINNVKNKIINIYNLIIQTIYIYYIIIKYSLLEESLDKEIINGYIGKVSKQINEYCENINNK
jgi:hypothetical protein